MSSQLSGISAIKACIRGSLSKARRPSMAVIFVGFFLYLTLPCSGQSLSVTCTNLTCPIIKSLADAYQAANPSVTVKIVAAPTNVAIRKLQTQPLGLVALDRSVTYTEVVRTQQLTNRALVGTPFAMTAAAIYVHKSHPAKSLTLDQLRKLFRFQVISWDELGFEADGTVLKEYRPEGHKLERGSIPIRLYLPSNKQGVNDVIDRRLLAGQSWPSRRTLFDTADSLLDKIATDTHGIGVAALTRHENVKALAIQTTADGPAIAPTMEAIRNRTYPLSHYLYVYSLGQPEGIAKDFVVLALSEAGQHRVESISNMVSCIATHPGK